MNPWPTLLRQALRALGAAVVSVLVWTLWFALTLLLIAQIYIASIQEFEVPASVLQSLEQRLELSGVRVKFGRTTFDPSGRLLMQDVSVVLPSFNEPVITAESLFVRLDPWALALRRFEPREVRVAGANCLVPAMLSSTGKSEEIVNHIDATLRPGENGEFLIDAFTARIAGLRLNAHGTIYIAPKNKEALPIAELIAGRYAAICRQVVAAAEKLEALDEPSVEVELSPSESRGAVASVVLLARGMKLDAPVAIEAAGLKLTTRFPLLGETPVMTRFEVAADELRLPHAAFIRGARLQMRGLFKPALFSLEPGEIEIAADSAEAEGLKATAFSAHLAPGPLPRLQATLLARVMEAPLAIGGEVDFSTQTAHVSFEGAIGPGWLDVVSARVGRDVRKFVDFTTPITASDGDAVFAAGWKFERVRARVNTGVVNAYHVTIDEAQGRVELTPGRFFAPEAYARLGKNFARGSYEQDFVTKDFRFLLEGQLAPLDISGWFTAWWPNFFRDFEFPAGPPRASVDVAGRWRDGRHSTVFVYADLVSPTIRGAHLDHARTLLFIRPGFFDGQEVLGALGTGVARGTFTYALETSPQPKWKTFAFTGTSTLDLGIAGQLIGPTSAEWLGPFKFERPPAVKASGRVERDPDGPPRKNLRIEVKSEGNFRFYDFPLERVEFTATLHDDEIAVDDVRAGFAGGLTSGHAKIWGRAPARRLSFEYILKDASLGRAIASLQELSARRKGAPPPPPGKFIQEKNNVRLDLTASGEGAYTDAFSYQGKGAAELKGVGLGELRLLGGLSETLRFTALRFTTASVNFRIEGPKLVFPEISITGDNSAIQAHGEYALDRQQLDFNAKLYPFQESGFILKKILDVALSPLSNVFEVKLTGTLDKPSWGLVLGPSNFLRSHAQPEPANTAPKAAGAAAPAAGEPPPSSAP